MIWVFGWSSTRPTTVGVRSFNNGRISLQTFALPSASTWKTNTCSTVVTRTMQTMEDLLDQKPDLITEVDEYGWTPLHWAVRINNVEKVSKLLEKDKSLSVAYTPANDDDEKIALHIAAAHGLVEVMKKLLSHCPDSWEIVDGKGQNILHIAVETEEGAVIDEARKYSWFNHLINQKDNIKNTPPDQNDNVVNTSSNQKDNVGNTPLDLASGRRWLYQRLRGDDMNLTMAPINWNQISRERHYIPRRKQELEEKRKKDIEKQQLLQEKIRKQIKENEEQIKRISESHLLVATLVATIAFTLGFTVPGNYGSNNYKSGEPVVLLREVAFKVFFVSNSIAAICSVATVFFYITVSNYSTGPDILLNAISRLYPVVYHVIKVSVAATLVAFVTGTYTARITQSRGLDIAICVIGFPPLLLAIPYLKVRVLCATLFDRVYGGSKACWNIKRIRN